MEKSSKKQKLKLKGGKAGLQALCGGCPQHRPACQRGAYNRYFRAPSDAKKVKKKASAR
jgi:hypothetical protein